MSLVQTLELARSIAEAIWGSVAMSFLILTGYWHFFVEPFHYWQLKDRDHPNHEFARRVNCYANTIILSGFFMFAILPNLGFP